MGDPRPSVEKDADDRSVFVGSIALLDALYETYREHIGITEPEGPSGPYIWCTCGWRSDDLGQNANPGNSYAIHLTNAQHAAAVKTLQPIVRRITPTEKGPAMTTISVAPINVNCPVCSARAGQSCQERDGFVSPAHASRQVAAITALTAGEWTPPVARSA